MGGMVPAIEAGFPQREIRYSLGLSAVDRGEEVIVVNDFINEVSLLPEIRWYLATGRCSTRTCCLVASGCGNSPALGVTGTAAER